MGMTVSRRRFVDTDRIANLYASLDGREVVWGWTNEARDYPDGTSIHLVVAANNFGTNRIPARPILSLSFDRHIDTLVALSDALNTVLLNARANNIDPALTAIAQRAASEMRRDFGNIGPMEPLAASTVANKGHGTIWIDTGHAQREVNYQIRSFS